MAPQAVKMTAAAELRPVDSHVWKACAGTAARVPTVGSRVYYFPQGHAEHSDSSLDLPSATACTRPFVLCHVASVRLLSDPSDEVFLSIRLDPIHPAFAALPAATPPSPPPPASVSFSFPSAAAAEEVGANDKPGGGFVHFAKILTRSDANNGGGFSVPRFCADSIFPPLSYNVGTPVQTLVVRDVHGRPWEFRHIYRGTPRRHLLTTGWSKFVNEKSLMAGDSVIFMKNSAEEELFVGIRRAIRCCPVDYHPLYPSLDVENKIGESQVFYKNSRNRVAAASVAEAIKSAEMSLSFEVMYYPRAGLLEFVVAEKEVETAMSVYWAPGMRVRMSVEAEDSARMTWFQGTVSAVATKDAGPWRMLQVTWDEPCVLQNIPSINAWQVELVSAGTRIQAPLVTLNTQIQVPFHNLMRMKSDQELFDMTNFTSKNFGVGFISYNYKTFPVGMQGARHDSTNLPSLLNIRSVRSGPTLHGQYGIGNAQEDKVCTELNIGSFGSITSNSSLEGSSPPSQGSTIESGREISRHLACRPSKRVRGSFQLFGQTYEIEKPNDALGKDYVDKQYGKGENALVPDYLYTHLELKQLFDNHEDSS